MSDEAKLWWKTQGHSYQEYGLWGNTSERLRLFPANIIFRSRKDRTASRRLYTYNYYYEFAVGYVEERVWIERREA